MTSDPQHEIRRAIRELVDATPPAPPLDDLVAYRIVGDRRVHRRRLVALAVSLCTIAVATVAIVAFARRGDHERVVDASTSTVAVTTTTPDSTSTAAAVVSPTLSTPPVGDISPDDVARYEALMRQVSVATALSPGPRILAGYEAARSKHYVSCISSKSPVTSVPPAPDEAILEAEDVRAAASFLFDDADRAQADGYSWMPSALVDFARRAGAASATVDASCQAETDHVLPPPADDDLAIVDSALYTEFAADPSLASVRSTWSTCMTSRGQAGHASPSALPIPGSLPRADEIALAVADVACRSASGYRDAKTRWFANHVAAWISQHPARVAQATAAIDQMQSATTSG